MATIRPFNALRPAADHAAEVAAVPYDVVNRKKLARWLPAIPSVSCTYRGRRSICPTARQSTAMKFTQGCR